MDRKLFKRDLALLQSEGLHRPVASTVPLSIHTKISLAELLTPHAILVPIKVWALADPVLLKVLPTFYLYDIILQNPSHVRRHSEAALRKIEDLKKWESRVQERLGETRAAAIVQKALYTGRLKRHLRKRLGERANGTKRQRPCNTER